MKKVIMIFLISFLIIPFFNSQERIWWPLPPKEDIKYITLNNINIAYRYYKKDSQKNTALLLYGLGGNIEMMDMFSYRLSEEYNILSFDLPGHGYSDKADKISLDKINIIIENLLDHLKLDKVSLIGYSLGGPVSLNFFANHKDRVDSLILLFTSANFSNTDSRKNLYKTVENFLGQNSTNNEREIMIPLLRNVYFTPRLLGLAAQLTGYNDTKSVFDIYKNTIYKNNNEVLSEIDVPTLVIGSSSDFLVPLAHTLYLKRNIKEARLRIYGLLGHLSVISAPRLLINEIKRFLQN